MISFELRKDPLSSNDNEAVNHALAEITYLSLGLAFASMTRH